MKRSSWTAAFFCLVFVGALFLPGEDSDKKQKQEPWEQIEKLLRAPRTSAQELDALRKLQQTGENAEFTQAMIALDKKEALSGLERLKGLAPGKIVPGAFRPATDADRAAMDLTRKAAMGPALISVQMAGKRLYSGCFVPLVFSGLRAFPDMNGPDMDEVRGGMLGAKRMGPSEYTITNPGDTEGKGRVSQTGEIQLNFSAAIPATGNYCLLAPAGPFFISGHSRVVGHGNSSACYDAKVWVDFYIALTVGANLVQISVEPIHYDGTRSQDRTMPFHHDLVLDPRYVFFHANGGDKVTLSFRLEVEAAANEDGLALAMVDYFGFPANTVHDYDSLVFRAD